MIIFMKYNRYEIPITRRQLFKNDGTFGFVKSISNTFWLAASALGY
jgi:hypothetical protein